MFSLFMELYKLIIRNSCVMLMQTLLFPHVYLTVIWNYEKYVHIMQSILHTHSINYSLYLFSALSYRNLSWPRHRVFAHIMLIIEKKECKLCCFYHKFHLRLWRHFTLYSSLQRFSIILSSNKLWTIKVKTLLRRTERIAQNFIIEFTFCLRRVWKRDHSVFIYQKT